MRAHHRRSGFVALVCALVLLVAGGSWSLVVNATPPQRVDDTAVVGASSAFSSDPAIACSPLQCLAVWVDARLPGAIFGTVMAADGTMLIPTGVLIATYAIHRLDLRFVAVADDDAAHEISGESLDVRWWPTDALPQETHRELEPLVAAARSVLGLT